MNWIFYSPFCVEKNDKVMYLPLRIILRYYMSTNDENYCCITTLSYTHSFDSSLHLFKSNSFSSQSYIRFCPRGISYLSCPPYGRESRGIWSIILTSCTVDMFLLFCILVFFSEQYAIEVWKSFHEFT